jgi:translation initiation factor IF-2
MGRTIKSPHAGQPVKVTGFDEIPKTGAIFTSSSDKKTIEKLQSEAKSDTVQEVLDPRIYRNAKVVVPVVIKADSLGTLDAVKRELKKRETDEVKIKIIGEGVGSISEGDIMLASSDDKTVVIGFGVKLEGKARDQVERFAMTPQLFDIIYKLSEWFDTLVESRLPYEEKEVSLGALKVIKIFSTQKEKHVIGGKVETGKIELDTIVKIVRRGVELGRGKIIELQSQKIKTKSVNEGNECGLMIETKIEMIPSDMIESIVIEKSRI